MALFGVLMRFTTFYLVLIPYHYRVNERRNLKKYGILYMCNYLILNGLCDYFSCVFSTSKPSM